MQPDETPEPPAPEGAAEDTDPFSENFNPDTLPTELQPGWKQLQGAFTRRTQEVAEERRRIEALGDIESIQQAVGLVQRIQDPTSWPQLYAELSAAMKQAGLTTEEAAAPAPTAPALDDLDPDLEPVKTHLEALTQQVEALKAERHAEVQAEQAALQAERQRMTFLTEIQRQEDVIREANPHFKQEHIDAIYDLAPATGGNLLAAAERYSQIVSAAKAELFASKQSVAENKAVQPIPNGNGATPKREAPKTVEDAAAEAEEMIRQMQAAGEIDLSSF